MTEGLRPRLDEISKRFGGNPPHHIAAYLGLVVEQLAVIADHLAPRIEVQSVEGGDPVRVNMKNVVQQGYVAPERLAEVRAAEDEFGYWSYEAQRERDKLGDRRYRRDWAKVRADVFKPSGKWMYQVWLDYTGEALEHYQGWAMARRALARATETGGSEVTFSALPEDWFMVVFDPPQGYPIVVYPSGTEGKA